VIFKEALVFIGQMVIKQQGDFYLQFGVVLLCYLKLDPKRTDVINVYFFFVKPDMKTLGKERRSDIIEPCRRYKVVIE
jgi:hypothetical protein